MAEQQISNLELPKKTRICWIDLIRSVAIFFAVLCHATESIYKLNLENMMSLSYQSRIFGFACFTAGRLGVPLFLMITGSLLLSRDYSNEDISRFWKKKWIHLLICTMIWFVIYDVFLVMKYHATISFLQLIEELLFVRKVGMSHVWYLPMILGMYILIPFVASLLKRYDKKLFLFPLLIYTLYSLGYNTISIIYRVYHPELPLSNQFSLGFSGAYYGIYILCGYFISEGTFKKIPSLLVVFISTIAFASIVYIQNWSYQNGYAYNVWYSDLLILVTSMGIYELASRIKNVYGYKAIRHISLYSFGIYLTHNFFIRVLAEYIQGLSVIMPAKVALLWGICFAASLVISMLIRKIPKIGKYLLYMK